MKLTVEIKENEYWWGGSVTDGGEMPFSQRTLFSRDFRRGWISNQTMPLFLSSHGRYIWSENCFAIEFCSGSISVEGEDITIKEAGSCLKDAYLEAMRTHFPFDGKRLPDLFFETAQYNGWMQFMYAPTQDGVLEYANGIIENGFTPGILMIDEGWQRSYGAWEFDPIKFPDPKGMIEKLHAMGFKLMLWVTPYVLCSGYDYVVNTLFNQNGERLFMRNEDGEVSIIQWWNGHCAVLDMTKECDRRYLSDQLDRLVSLGVDGFKFDGGDVGVYREGATVNGTPSSSATAEERNDAWNKFGAMYEFHEYKDSYKQGGRNMIQRLSDKAHVWQGHGLADILPASLVQGILGTPFICPDMIGGGEWSYFRYIAKSVADGELFVRMAQCSALLPMMQFSLAPWQYLNGEHLKLCLNAARLHKEMSPYILTLVRHAETSGEPIVRMLEYCYPHQGFAEVTDCFMLGERYLVAPVTVRGQTEKSLRLPSGRWRYCNGTIYEGGNVTVPAPLDVLPYFEKI